MFEPMKFYSMFIINMWANPNNSNMTGYRTATWLSPFNCLSYAKRMLITWYGKGKGSDQLVQLHCLIRAFAVSTHHVYVHCGIYNQKIKAPATTHGFPLIWVFNIRGAAPCLANFFTWAALYFVTFQSELLTSLFLLSVISMMKVLDPEQLS